jgi:hypothetical protein
MTQRHLNFKNALTLQAAKFRAKHEAPFIKYICTMCNDENITHIYMTDIYMQLYDTTTSEFKNKIPHTASSHVPRKI